MTTIEGVKKFLTYVKNILVLCLVIFLIWWVIPSQKNRQATTVSQPTVPITYVGGPNLPAVIIDIQPGQPHFVVFTGRQMMRAEPKNGPIIMTAVNDSLQVETSEKIMVAPGQRMDAKKSFKYSPSRLKLEAPQGASGAVRVHIYPDR